MDEFTKSEIERINMLYGTDFEGITPDDAKLIARFESNKATREAEFKAYEDALMQKTQNEIAQSQALYEQAKSNLQELHDLALARFEAVSNGI